MISKEECTTKRSRINFLDNLRSIIILLVILYHAGGVYESSGIWASFWIVDDPATNNFVGILNTVIDIFTMPTLFFISGYLAPASLKSRTGWKFLKAKFQRLIVPWIIAVFTLIPLYKVIFLYARNMPQENWASYFFFSNGIIGQSWLWFLPVLFAFNILYLLLSKAKIKIPNISLKGAVICTFLAGFARSAGRDILGLRGWTEIGVLDFRNETFLIYFAVFLLGALCFRLRIFDAKPKSKMLYTIVIAIAWIPITVYIFFSHYPWFSPGNFIVSEIIDRLILWFSYQLSLLCLVYVMIETFWRYFDKPGRIWSELNQNSYHVYIIHVIVMGGIAMILLNSAMPSLPKYLTLAVSTYVASNLIISQYRRNLDHYHKKRLDKLALPGPDRRSTRRKQGSITPTYHHSDLDQRKHPMQAKQVFSTYNSKEDGDDWGQFKHCPTCGMRLVLKEKGGKHRPACPNCQFVQFRNPSPGVVVLIEKEGQVLLGRRSENYGAKKWGLPQGFIEFDEDFMTAAIREVKEETGLDVEIRSLLSVVSNFLSPRLHTLAIALLARVVGGELCTADDLDALAWFPLSGPWPEMAFEADKHICERYYRAQLAGAPVDPGYAVVERVGSTNTTSG
jgi:ADP-ribose pyrophosphatase YjhB (NUDIX family)/peptidoglycan/LPS O-acetylase OafA/YrhL